MTALLALASAVLVGGADFLGGFASRTAAGVRVAALAQAAGLPVALVLSIAYGYERLSGPDVTWSFASGAAVAVGLGCFYTAMGRGLISVVAPVAAVTGALLPVGYALVRGERPGLAALAGIGIALAAVAVISIAPSDPAHAHVAVTPAVVGLAILAGAFFGLFYVFFSRISADAGLWPVTLERIASTCTLATLAPALTRRCFAGLRPVAPFAFGVGALEVAATVPLLLALQRGPVAIASVMASLYPVMTVLLAGIVLRERMSRMQLAGVVCALAAVVLVSAS